MLTNPLIEEIIDLANNELLFALFAKAVRGYNREENVIPVNTIIASFLPYENKSTYFEDENASTCLKTEIIIKMTVYAHSSRKGKQLNAIAEVVCDFLSEYYIGTMTSFEIGDLKYNDVANSITLPCYLRFVYNTCALEEDDGSLTNSVPESFFCKSHVNNTDIHLSEDDRSFLNEPVVIGSYTGSGGETAQDVSLGFRPRVVIVYRNSYHIASYSADDETSKCYAGIAADSSYTRGILILDDGFRVRTVATSNATSYLNDEGGTYTYIAFR